MKSFPEDIELSELIQKGNIAAFNLLFEKYSGRLYSFGLKYLHSKEDAENLVQSVFHKLWERRKLLRKEASLKSYLFTIAYNDICKFIGKGKIRIISKSMSVQSFNFM